MCDVFSDRQTDRLAVLKLLLMLFEERTNPFWWVCEYLGTSVGSLHYVSSALLSD